jgi:hypothetical protein
VRRERIAGAECRRERQADDEEDGAQGVAIIASFAPALPAISIIYTRQQEVPRMAP